MALPADDYLVSSAHDASPAEAFASHRARAMGIAKHFALTRPLTKVHGPCGENEVTALCAHLHAATDERDAEFAGQLEAIRTAMHKLELKNDGLVGTTGASTDRDYDMTLKGLVVVLHRYGSLLTDDDVNFILERLIPGHMFGGHRSSIEIVAQTAANIPTPETENHLLCIESSRYLLNQFMHGRPGFNPVLHDNNNNGLTKWLLAYLQRVARHDFLEFNSRPYARMSLHALHNLYEFANDDLLVTAAQILLDYTMVKYALSSSRGRRVTPFRRHQQEINHQNNARNDLYGGDGGDQVSGFFLGHVGLVDAAGRPAPFPSTLAYCGLIASTSTYRPPPVAYELALTPAQPCLHRFYHGNRPVLPGLSGLPVGMLADPGLEIYFRSPSFVLSAGGSFLSSGYGFDDVDIGKDAWEETSRAQATTLIPTRLETRAFSDLIRFEPYPDPIVDPYADDLDDADKMHTVAVNIGVSRGLIAGANLRPAERKTVLEFSTPQAMALAVSRHLDPAGNLIIRLMVGWQQNDGISIAKAQTTRLLGIDGVEGIEGLVRLFDPAGAVQATSDRAPALAGHGNRLFLAWRGSGNTELNLAFSDDGGATFKGTMRFNQSSDHAPALVSHAGRLFLAWTGLDDQLNIAKVALFSRAQGGFGIDSTLEDHRVLQDSSDAGPALASHNGKLFLAWRGSGNTALNLAFFDETGTALAGKQPLADSSNHAPALASHRGRLFISWAGRGNDQINVAAVDLFASTAGAFGIEGLTRKVVLDDFSTEPPSLCSYDDQLFVAWKGEGDDNLNLRLSRDGTFRDPGPWLWGDRRNAGFYLAAYRTPPTRPEPGDPARPLDNLAIVYAMEAPAPDDLNGMTFEQFQAAVLDRNRELPARFDYDSSYEFHAPDGKRFRVHFKLTGNPYRARVVDLDDPVEDFATLPLVSGEVLSAPGHDGLIKIHDPGCPSAPVVLDFSNAETPERHDNLAACPQPWVDRAQALLDLAGRLSEAGDHVGARLALVDRADIFALLTAADPSFWPNLVAAWTALAQTATRLAADGATAAAVATQKALVNLLAAFEPTPDQALEAALMLAEGRYYLVLRLIADQQLEEAGGLTDQT
ncbi:hypothetical protein, partial [Streptomyces sp. NPDC058695]|uniref:hypothetical protein n=1 Tax=Streptomyces sp. NPDC058695 TaxID=3346604 RepID=UPI0036629789